MKLAKSKFEQIIREEVAAALLEREYDDVWQDPKTGKWWIQDDEGNKSGPHPTAAAARSSFRRPQRQLRRFGRRIPRRESIDSAAIAIAKLKENTEIELATLIKKAIVEAGGMRGLRKKTKTGAIAKAREAAKKAEELSQTPEEKEKAEQDRQARLAKFSHLYDDDKESQDE